MSDMIIKQKTPGFEQPCFQTGLAAGFDICAVYNVLVRPGEYELVPTGLFIEEWPSVVWLDDGDTSVAELQIRPRSSLIKKGLWVIPGTVDGDYRNEIFVSVYNPGTKHVLVNKGDRIAQGVISVVFRPSCIPIKNVSRIGGFGSTGS